MKKRIYLNKAETWDGTTDDGFVSGHTVYVEDPEVCYSPVLDADGNQLMYTEYKHPLGFDLKPKDPI